MWPTTACDQTTPLTWTVGSASAGAAGRGPRAGGATGAGGGRGGAGQRGRWGRGAAARAPHRPRGPARPPRGPASAGRRGGDGKACGNLVRVVGRSAPGARIAPPRGRRIRSAGGRSRDGPGEDRRPG